MLQQIQVDSAWIERYPGRVTRISQTKGTGVDVPERARLRWLGGAPERAGTPASVGKGSAGLVAAAAMHAACGPGDM